MLLGHHKVFFVFCFCMIAFLYLQPQYVHMIWETDDKIRNDSHQKEVHLWKWWKEWRGRQVMGEWLTNGGKSPAYKVIPFICCHKSCKISTLITNHYQDRSIADTEMTYLW